MAAPEGGLVIAAAQSVSLDGDVAANVARHLAFVDAARERGAHLVVFPELSLTGYEPARAHEVALRPDDPRLAPLRTAARDAALTIVAGAPLASAHGLHIAAFIAAPDGTITVYAKQYLHPGEAAFFVPGPAGAVVRVNGAAVGVAICADLGHVEHAAAAAASGAVVYAVGALITPEGYPADERLLRGHARNHDMVVLMANHSAPTGGWIPAGRSAVWAAGGDAIAAAAGTAESLVIARQDAATWRGEIIAVDA